MQEKRPLNPREIKVIENTMQARGLPEEVIGLVGDDLRFGLSKEETDQYLSKNFTFEQMKVYSQGLKSDVPAEVMELLSSGKMSAQKMAIVVEFADKGIPIDTIRSALQEDGTAHALRTILKRVWAEVEKVKLEPKTEGDYEYANTILGEVREVINNIAEQGKRYQRLNEKLEQFGAQQVEEAEKNRLVKQIEERNKHLDELNAHLTEAHETIARLREEIERLKSELKQEAPVKEEKQHGVESVVSESMPDKSVKSSPKQPVPVPRYIVTAQDNSSIEIEVQPKENQSVVAAFLSRLAFKKKIDLVRLVTEGELSAQQLIQIRQGIEKGLTGDQLKLLIHKKPPAEQMAEIIQIAIYENGREG